MILISHRGNIDGRNIDLENNPNYIDIALFKGFDVEVDVWYKDKTFYLGHDEPDHPIDIIWLIERKNKLWIHCKDIESLFQLKEYKNELNYFWHQEDDVTLTSKGFFWTYPGKKLTSNSIAVMPEIEPFENINISFGICSDNVNYYQTIFSE